MREMPVNRAGQILGIKRLADVANVLGPRDCCAYAFKIRDYNMCGGRVGYPSQKLQQPVPTAIQLPAGVRRPDRHADAFATAREAASVWGGYAAKLLGHKGHTMAIHHANDMSSAYTKEVRDGLGNVRVVCGKFGVI